MALIIKSGTTGTFLVINGDGSINVVVSGVIQSDVTDRVSRLLGHVVVDNLSSALDITDRASRILGHAVIDNFPSVQPVKQIKDTGRTNVTISADRVAGRNAEALETLTINVGGTMSSGPSYTVTPGKILRLTSLQVEVLNTANTINRVLVRVRQAASVLVSSPVIAMGMAVALTAVTVSGGQDSISFPGGIEVAGSQQVGISQLCTVTTAGIVSFLLQGYEYTP